MESKEITFVVEDSGERLDKLILPHVEDLSRSQIQSLIKDGYVRVDGDTVKPGVKLRGGETVTVTLPETEETPELQPEDVDLTVVFEDDDLAVIEKPAGMVTHPGAGHSDGTLVNAMIARWPQIAAMDDPDGRNGIVHRLDKDTSGLMVIAKNEVALADLMAQFHNRTVEKTYLALLERTPKTHNGRIDAPIGRDPKQRKRMAVIREGREAITEFTVMDTNFEHGQALVEFKLLTGRTHQIRVHAAFIGCPIVGDRIYGYRKQRTRMKRNFLHASRLIFDHPFTGERLTFESELPVGLKNVMEKLRL